MERTYSWWPSNRVVGRGIFTNIVKSSAVGCELWWRYIPREKAAGYILAGKGVITNEKEAAKEGSSCEVLVVCFKAR